MNIQRKNSAYHFRMQSEREQTLGVLLLHLFNLCLQENVPIDTTSHVSQPAVVDATIWKSG